MVEVTGRQADTSQESLGNHVLCDFKLAKENKEHLIDPFRLEASLRGAVEHVGATVLNIHCHRFEGDEAGFTLNLSLSESHATIHTWPEYNKAAMDIYTCGESNPREALVFFFDELEAEGIICEDCNILHIVRGI